MRESEMEVNWGGQDQTVKNLHSILCKSKLCLFDLNLII